LRNIKNQNNTMSSTKKQARSASKKAAPKEAKAKNEKKQRV
jgi:hypothetical protein